MKIDYKKIIVVAVLIIMGTILYSWLHVSGKEIKGVADISEKHTVVITVEPNRGEYVEYSLNRIQIEMLKTLILNSSFTQKFSSIMYYPSGTQRYNIDIHWNNGWNSLRISSVGNEFITINEQFKDRFLKINNPDWEKELKEIISISK